MFYILIISLIVYRFMFFKIDAEEMNASLLDQHRRGRHHHTGGRKHPAQRHRAVSQLIWFPFIKGFTLFFWATGTWWIPLLFICRRMASHLQTLPADLSSRLLGIGLPNGHVHGLPPSNWQKR